MIFTTVFSSCQWIRNKKNDARDKVFPIFNAGEPDTKYNKKRFEEYLEVPVTGDVKNIYCYGDFIGIDYKVLFSFSCDSVTIRHIIEKKEMAPDNDDHYSRLFFNVELPWWNQQEIDTLRPFKKGTEGELWQYLWYNKNEKRAYYEEFSL